MDTKTILLDVGGTFIKCSDGRTIPIDSAGSREDIASSLRLAVGDADNIAVAIPGPFNYNEGIFKMTHKFASVFGEYFKDLAGRPNATIKYMHDSNCMLLGEIVSGNGVGYENVALVALGTGLGYSMSIAGNILTNESGSPLVTIYKTPYRDGILEDYVSKRGFIRAYKEEAGEYFRDDITVKEIAMQAFDGDTASKAAITKCSAILASAIAPILTKYKVDCLLFGGQIARSFDLMKEGLMSGLSSVTGLKKISLVSDIDNSAFKGLQALISK